MELEQELERELEQEQELERELEQERERELERELELELEQEQEREREQEQEMIPRTAIIEALALATPEQRTFAISFLASCNVSKGVWHCRKCGTPVEVPAGATTKSYQTLLREAKERSGVTCTLSVVRRALDNLQRRGVVTIERKFSTGTKTKHCHALIQVKNWDVAWREVLDRYENDHVVTKRKLRRGASTLDEKKKNSSEEKNKCASEDAFAIASHWLGELGSTRLRDKPLVQRYAGEGVGKAHRRKDAPRWAEKLDRIMQRHGCTPQELRALIDWILADSFWQSVARSPHYLLKRDKQDYYGYDSLLAAKTAEGRKTRRTHRKGTQREMNYEDEG